MDGLVALLTEDVRLSMPPFPLEYIGREAADTLLHDRRRRRPGFASCRRGRTGSRRSAYLPPRPHRTATSLLVVTLAGGQVSEITRFDAGVLQHFGLPRILPS